MVVSEAVTSLTKGIGDLGFDGVPLRIDSREEIVFGGKNCQARLGFPSVCRVVVKFDEPVLLAGKRR